MCQPLFRAAWPQVTDILVGWDRKGLADLIPAGNHPGRPAKMVVGKPAVLLDAVHWTPKRAAQEPASRGFPRRTWRIRPATLFRRGARAQARHARRRRPDAERRPAVEIPRNPCAFRVAARPGGSDAGERTRNTGTCAWLAPRVDRRPERVAMGPRVRAGGARRI